MLGRVFCLVFALSSAGWAVSPEEMPELAKSRAGDLLLSTYFTVDGTLELANSEAARADALRYLHALGIGKVYVESYRGASVADEATLTAARDFLKQQGFAVSAGIATYPAEGFGVVANEGLPWYNFQAPESQRLLEEVVRRTARVFDEIIVDDFFCSGDTSEISQQFRQNRTWPEYRRDLFTALSQRMIIAPAREERPGVTMIIKFPQWYDLFHIYGYDVSREPQLYDRVYVGTETRGPNTQKYGFTQPYEGFINYRWIASMAGGKIGGAWFDHGDTDQHDFLDQAYQSVLAGAPELMLFSHNALKDGHPGHQELRDHFTNLANLAALVRDHPVEGVVGYKPPNSDAGTDIYLMDQVGMLGVPLVPASSFPADAPMLFLPTQAATDAKIGEKVEHWLQEGSRRLVMTAGFLAATASPELAALAGLQGPVALAPARTATIVNSNESQLLDAPLGLAAHLVPDRAEVVLEAQVDSGRSPYLTTLHRNDDFVSVLNCETFSQADFEAVNEVLLSPRRLGMLVLPEAWLAALRSAFAGALGEAFSAPARVTMQPLRDHAAIVIQNYRDEPALVRVDMNAILGPELAATLAPVSGEGVSLEKGIYTAELPARVHLVFEFLQNQSAEGK